MAALAAVTLLGLPPAFADLRSLRATENNNYFHANHRMIKRLRGYLKAKLAFLAIAPIAAFMARGY